MEELNCSAPKGGGVDGRGGLMLELMFGYDYYGGYTSHRAVWCGMS